MFRTKIGHAFLNVRELKRSVDFYSTYLNLRVTEKVGEDVAFLSSGDQHHELALLALGLEAAAPVSNGIGLGHLAFEVPDKRSLAEAYRMLTGGKVNVSPVDHQVAWGLYFHDPDGNNIEICCDTRQEPDGAKAWGGQNRKLAPDRILAALESGITK